MKKTILKTTCMGQILKLTILTAKQLFYSTLFHDIRIFILWQRQLQFYRHARPPLKMSTGYRHTLYIHSTHTVHARYTHGTRTVHARQSHGTRTVHTLYMHGKRKIRDQRPETQYFIIDNFIKDIRVHFIFHVFFMYFKKDLKSC